MLRSLRRSLLAALALFSAYALLSGPLLVVASRNPSKLAELTTAAYAPLLHVYHEGPDPLSHALGRYWGLWGCLLSPPIQRIPAV